LEREGGGCDDLRSRDDVELLRSGLARYFVVFKLGSFADCREQGTSSCWPKHKQFLAEENQQKRKLITFQTAKLLVPERDFPKLINVPVLICSLKSIRTVLLT
jgi:hypothetical protein